MRFVYRVFLLPFQSKRYPRVNGDQSGKRFVASGRIYLHDTLLIVLWSRSKAYDGHIVEIPFVRQILR
jgi:hypothetical protein